jgi:hypothetical protein
MLKLLNSKRMAWFRMRLRVFLNTMSERASDKMASQNQGES